MQMLYKAIHWTGIAAITLLFATALTGVLEMDFNIHRAAAFAAVAVAAAHGLMVLYKYFKYVRRPVAPKTGGQQP